MCGQCIWSTGRQLIGDGDALLLLSRGDLKAATESRIIAAQDEALQIKDRVIKIFKQT
jgi:hypothetical protein